MLFICIHVTVRMIIWLMCNLQVIVLNELVNWFPSSCYAGYVHAVDWVGVCGEYEYIRHDLVSNTAQPLLEGLMRYLIRRCLYVKYRHDARLEVGL